MTGRHAAATELRELAPPPIGRYRRRGLVSQVGALVAFAILVAVVAGAAAATPRLTAVLLGADLRGTVASASPAYRDPITTVVTPADPTADDPYVLAGPTWEHVPAMLRAVRSTVRPALRNVLDGGHAVGIATGWPVPGDVDAPTAFSADGPAGGVRKMTTWRIEASPELRADARLVRGHWPAPSTTVDDHSVMQVVATAATARTMGWRLGRTAAFGPSANGSFRVELVGLLAPRDPADGFWSIDPNRAAVSRTTTPDGTPILHGTVFAASSSWADVASRIGGTQVSVWFGVRPARFDTASLPAVGSDLAAFLANPRLVNATRGDLRTLQFQTFLPQIVALYTARADASAAILALSATGPLGVAGVTVLLGTRGLLDRRRAVRVLLRSRGASAGSLAVGAARDVGLASVPGAVVGSAAAAIAIPAGSVASLVAASLVCAFGPPIVAAIVAGSGAVAQVRPRRRIALERFRWVAETLAVAVAAGAVVVVVRQGTGASGAAPGPVGGVDPLVTATPLLLAAAVAVLLLRIRPRLARGLVGLVRRRGAAAFVGTAEDVRGGSSAGWVLATIVGATSIGVLAGVVLRSAAAVDLPTSGSARGLDTDPLVSGLGAVVLAGLVLSAVMTAAAIALTVVSAAPARQRRGAMLRTLGLTARQRTAVTLWELVPRVLLGVVAGLVLGLLAMLAIVPAVLPPTRHARSVLTIDPGAIGLTSLLFAGAAALATIAAVVTDRRRSGVLDERSDA